jgi:hypothetical protein
MTNPELAQDRLEVILELLVRMTVEQSGRDLLQRIRSAKLQALEKARTGDPRPGAPLAPLKEAVDSELRNLDSPYRDLTRPELYQVATDFCDRTIAGVDAWDESDRDRWREVCSQVIELSSAVI